MEDISIIIPVHNEASNIVTLHQKLQDVIHKMDKSCEMIFIDDGSRDESFSILSQIAKNDQRVKVVQFLRNFGQTASFTCGIKYSTGKLIVTIDGDLQNDPADIPKLVDKLNQGYDLVTGWRKKRKDPLFTRRIPSQIANKLISWVLGGNLHDHGCSLKVFRSQLFKDINLYGETHRFIPILAIHKGAKVMEMEITHHSRKFGKPNYGLSRTFRVLCDLISLKFIGCYQNKPMYVFGGSAMFFFFLGLLSAIFVITRRIFFKGAWVSPMLFISLICIIAAIQFILTGLLAEMVARIYFESGEKQSYIIKKKINL
jgi:glycosyltransferase involved in cell wall biosynthesis